MRTSATAASEKTMCNKNSSRFTHRHHDMVNLASKLGLMVNIVFDFEA